MLRWREQLLLASAGWNRDDNWNRNLFSNWLTCSTNTFLGNWQGLRVARNTKGEKQEKNTHTHTIWKHSPDCLERDAGQGSTWPRPTTQHAQFSLVTSKCLLFALFADVAIVVVVEARMLCGRLPRIIYLCICFELPTTAPARAEVARNWGLPHINHSQQHAIAGPTTAHRPIGPPPRVPAANTPFVLLRKNRSLYSIAMKINAYSQN